MRGTAPAQVDGARASLVLGGGGLFSAADAMVLREAEPMAWLMEMAMAHDDKDLWGQCYCC